MAERRAPEPDQNLECVHLSETGLLRQHNEDSTCTDPGRGLAILADGIGGYEAGEVASAIAVTNIHRVVTKALETLTLSEADANSGPNPFALLLRDAIEQTNTLIRNIAQSEERCKKMGTTIVCALFHNNQVSIAHAGDSRLYLFRNNVLKQLTKDHSMREEFLENSSRSRAEIEERVPKNVITQALGLRPEIKTTLTEQDTGRNDIYLLCSDGLSDMATDEEIGLTIGLYGANLARCAESLVRLAHHGGGRDNISVILCRQRGDGGGP